MSVDAGAIISDFWNALFRGGAGTFRGNPEKGLSPEFVVHYQKFIKPLVQEYEQKRMMALGQVRRRGRLAVAFNLGVYALSYYLNTQKQMEFLNIGTAILMIGGLVLFYYAYFPISALKGNIKGKVYPLIFKYFGDHFSYSPVSQLSARSLKSSDIVPFFDEEKNEDYIRGVYQGVKLELMESVLSKEIRAQRQGKTERRNEEVFRGLFIVFNMHKSFSGKTVVRRDFGKVGNWLMDKTSSMQTVHLEDPVFENKFQVMSTDQVEARYLLTTSFMERLLAVEDIFRTGEFLGGGQLQCSFYDHQLVFAIPSQQNRFEIGTISRPMTFVDEINEILKQMNLIFDMINILKLHENTGL